MQVEPKTWRGRVTLVICATLLIAFAALSYSAVLTKSATYDEPLHLVGGFVHLHDLDFRINPEDPALFGYWAALPLGGDAIQYDPRDPSLLAAAERIDQQWEFVTRVLYETPANDFEALFARARAMFVLLGVATGALAAWWSYRLAGAAAAVVCTVLFAFDPNFLAHSALVKNDVPLALVMLALVIAIWQYGRRGTAAWLLLIGLACGAAVNVKYSGLLMGPLTLLALLIRALLPEPWIVMRRRLETRSARILTAGASCVVVAIIGYAVTWASYGFRFTPTDDPRVRLNTRLFAEVVPIKQFVARHGRPPTQEEIGKMEIPMLPRLVIMAESREMLPQPWLNGFMFTYANTIVRSSFLMGERSITGFWHYFPAAMLFKSPLATLVAAAVLLVAAMWVRRARRKDFFHGSSAKRVDRWTWICLILPLAVYGISAVTANLNLGLRHVLPMYPLIYIAMSMGAVMSLRLRPRAARIALGLLGAGLVVETVSAWPNYIPFFNSAFGGWRGGLALLSDSNLDWGQDLEALAEWHRQNPDVPLYLSYFGTAKPAAYGIRYSDLQDTLDLQGTYPPGVAAISATHLQGVYSLRDEYRVFREQAQPIDVLGGTIYLYHFPLTSE